MKDVVSDYVFFWIEDHIALVSPQYLRVVINEMAYFSADGFYILGSTKVLLKILAFPGKLMRAMNSLYLLC